MTPMRRPHPGGRSRARGWWLRPVLGAFGALSYYAFAVRPWLLYWATTTDEATTRLAGDDLVPGAAYVTTRGVTVQSPADAIWPWLVQLGQGRGGFYTYDRLEHLVGAAIRSADRIVPELQQLAVGDTIRLSPVGGPKVALLEPGRSLVLSETMDLRTGQSVPSTPRRWWTMDWTWSFTLRSSMDGATRLLIRTRADFRPRAFLKIAMVLFLEPAHFVMERGMLLGIKQRAERAIP